MNLTHVRLLVDDFSLCFRFYRDGLRLPVQLGEEDGVYAEFVAGDCVLALFRRELMSQAIGAPGGTTASGDAVVLTFNVASVDATYDELSGRGVEFTMGPTDRPEWFLRTAHLRDPAGTLIEIYEDRPPEGDDR